MNRKGKSREYAKVNEIANALKKIPTREGNVLGPRTYLIRGSAFCNHNMHNCKQSYTNIFRLPRIGRDGAGIEPETSV